MNMKYFCILVLLCCTTHFTFGQVVEFDFQCDQSAREFRLNLRNMTNDTIYIINQSHYNMFSGSYIYLSTKDKKRKIDYNIVSFWDSENGKWPLVKILVAHGSMTLHWPFRFINGDNAVEAELRLAVIGKDASGKTGTYEYTKKLIISH